MEPPRPRPTASPSLPGLQIQHQPRSSASIFVHALHLLDLDQHPSYPNITLSTYASTNKAASQSIQARVKATEWALFHLFRLYSPSEAASRLSPHFPPTSPLQSKNLRAGLYSWFTELKVNGVLPRDVVLRKTMLDECKGEKFEEMLARFAMVVRHQDLSLKASAYSAQLTQSRKNLELGLAEIRCQSPSRTGKGQPFSEEVHDLLRDQVHLAFTSDRRWAKYLFEGTSSHASSMTSALAMPNAPFAADSGTDLLARVSHREFEQDPDQPMRELQATIAQNEARLRQLALLRDSTLENIKVDSEKLEPISRMPTRTASSDQPILTISSKDSSPTIAAPRFGRHQDIVLMA